MPVFRLPPCCVLVHAHAHVHSQYTSRSEQEYYDIPFGTKVGLGVGYFALIAALLGGWAWNKRRLKPLKRLKAEQKWREEHGDVDFRAKFKALKQDEEDGQSA